VPAGHLIKGLMAVFSAIIVIMAFDATTLLFSKVTVALVFGIALCWGILVFSLLIFWSYRGLRIQIKDGRLPLDYGLFNKRSLLLKERKVELFPRTG
jgi:uncharacterized membrane protein YdbT with pleckstrin-like domain